MEAQGWKVVSLDGKISDTLTANSQGVIEIIYYPMSGESYRGLQASYGDTLLPITHKMTVIGNRTNRSAAATYVQDVPTS